MTEGRRHPSVPPEALEKTAKQLLRAQATKKAVIRGFTKGVDAIEENLDGLEEGDSSEARELVRTLEGNKVARRALTRILAIDSLWRIQVRESVPKTED